MKRAIIVLLFVVAIGAGAGAIYIRRGGTEISVATAPITRGEIIDAVASTGTLQAVVSVTVGSQVSGNIAWLGADFNSIVKKDQIIAKLDPTLFQAQVAQSSANLANQKAQLGKDLVNQNYLKITYQRSVDLRQRGIITQDALDASKSAVDQSAAQIDLDKAQIEQAQAQLNSSQTNLDHSIIESPIDGIVTQRSVDVGQTVAASMTAPQLFIIAADLTKMQVSANIDESDVGRVRPGQDVTFRVDAYPGEEFRGMVAQIRLNPIVVNNVTTYATMINVPNDDLRLKPGMTANLKVQIAKRSDSLRIPNTALRFRPNADMFAALNQAVPPEAQAGGRGGRGGRGRGGDQTAAAAGATATGAPAAGASAAGTPATAAGQAASTQPGAAGGGGRGGDGQGRLDRFKAMSSDQQRQFIARMSDRGQDTSAFEKLMSASGAPAAKGAPAAAKGAAASKAAAAKNSNAAFQFVPKYGSAQSSQSIDALFAPLPTVESRGRAWIFVDHQLKPVNLRLGITDGTYTELLGDELQPPMEVVTVVTGLGSIRSTAATGSGNPLMPQRGGPGGQGGGPGRGR
jgi:HlyD family secretion protein